MQPNRRATRIPESPTLALDARAKALIASGVDVVNMAAGEPDFQAPQMVQEAAVAAIEGGQVRYTPPAGRPSLRETIARHLTTTRGVDFVPEEVVVCHSGKHALSHTLLALVTPGDEVALLAPVWCSYAEQVRFAGGEPRTVLPRADLGPDFAAIEAALGPRTRGVMLNSPSNPSGYVWTKEEIDRLGTLATEHDLWIVSDEIYRRLVYEGEPNVSPVQISDAVRERTVVVDGASKTFAMTGYRMGFLAAPQPLARAVTRLQSQLSGSPNAVSQAAYEAALTAEPPEVETMVRAYDERRRVLVEGLRELGLETPWPRGAFYAFPTVADRLDERGSEGFCADLLDQQHLAIVPGAAFAMDDHVRLTYATDLGEVRRALERLGSFLARADAARGPKGLRA